MWNAFVALFLLTIAALFVLIFWGVGGIGAAYLAAFVGTLALAIGSSIRSAIRRS